MLFFIRGNPWREKIWSYPNTLVTDQILRLTHYYKKDSQNRAEMYLINLISMINSTQWQVQGKYIFTLIYLFI